MCTILFLFSCSQPLSNYMNFNDTEGIYTYTFEAEKRVSCVEVLQCYEIQQYYILTNHLHVYYIIILLPPF